VPAEFTPDQIDDLRELRDVCEQFETDLVIIGAMAYKIFFPDEDRFTADIDATIALELDEFEELSTRLEQSGWKRDPNMEQRWLTHRGTYFDIIPAGRELRHAKEILWPKSQFAMSLVGFDHVFAGAVPHALTKTLTVKTIPPPVLALTKIVSFLDDPHGRSRDLADIRGLLIRYAEGTDRIFEDAVFDAQLTDISLANAFLLGFDLAQICTAEERTFVERFVTRFENHEDEFAMKVAAFKTGLRGHRTSST
jgi:predicted nucleotidyltransferase